MQASVLYPSESLPEPELRPSSVIDIYHAVDALPGIKKSFIGSGYVMTYYCIVVKMRPINRSTAAEYTRELIVKHVSGRLKVAPEHK